MLSTSETKTTTRKKGLPQKTQKNKQKKPHKNNKTQTNQTKQKTKIKTNQKPHNKQKQKLQKLYQRWYRGSTTCANSAAPPESPPWAERHKSQLSLYRKAGNVQSSSAFKLPFLQDMKHGFPQIFEDHCFTVTHPDFMLSGKNKETNPGILLTRSEAHIVHFDS